MKVILAVHHISFTTCDLDRILCFYRDLLGLPQVLDFKVTGNAEFDRVVGLSGCRARSAYLQAGNIFLEFWEFAEPAGRGPVPDRPVCDAGLTHVCFNIEDVMATHDMLAEAGVKFVSAPQNLGSVIVAYARDPDGNIVELRQPLQELAAVALAPAMVEAAGRNLSRS